MFKKDTERGRRTERVRSGFRGANIVLCDRGAGDIGALTLTVYQAIQLGFVPFSVGIIIVPKKKKVTKNKLPLINQEYSICHMMDGKSV